MDMNISRLNFFVYTGKPPRQIRDISLPFTPQVFNTPLVRTRSWTERNKTRYRMANKLRKFGKILELPIAGREVTVSEGLLVQLTEEKRSKWSPQTLIWCWWHVLVCTEISSHSCDIPQFQHFKALYNWYKAMDKLICTINFPEVNTKCANYF